MNKKRAFTLAEVLITLGIIGVVAAMTLPILIQKYNKIVWYNQFRKAASQLENAFKMYQLDHDCVGDISLCMNQSAGSYATITNFVDDISKYFNIAQKITNDNYQNICKNYINMPIKESFGKNIEPNPDSLYYCSDDWGGLGSSDFHAFITNNGIMYNFSLDLNYGGDTIMDINGPNKGPNIIGRDIFIFYTTVTDDYPKSKSNIVWGGSKFHNEPCEANNEYGGWGCAAKLLQEGKMNY